MKVITKEIELTLRQCEELADISKTINDDHDAGLTGIFLAQIGPDTHPDQKKIKCHYYPGRAADAVVTFMDMLAEVIGHYEE